MTVSGSANIKATIKWSELYPVGGLEQGASFNALLAASDEA